MFCFGPDTENKLCKVPGSFTDRDVGWDNMRVTDIKHKKQIGCILGLILGFH